MNLLRHLGNPQRGLLHGLAIRLLYCVSGLSRLFEELQQRKVGLVSLRDGLDLNTAAGRLMAHVLASVAAYELEVKTERQLAGIDAARGRMAVSALGMDAEREQVSR